MAKESKTLSKREQQIIDCVKTHRSDFKVAVEPQSVDKIFPDYAKTVDDVIIYKLGKTLVQWLEQWRQY